jgi:hypothetical protein
MLPKRVASFFCGYWQLKPLIFTAMENAKNQHDEKNPTYVGLSPSELEDEKELGFDQYSNRGVNPKDYDETPNQANATQGKPVHPVPTNAVKTTKQPYWAIWTTI